jgi:hypothetical protein
MKRSVPAGVAAAIFAALLAAAAQAAPVATGTALPALELADQHDRPWRIERGTRLLLFAVDKVASDRVTESLRPLGRDALDARDAVFLADVHAMPALVTRMFALPALRELPFAVGLGRDATLTADLPRRAGQVTAFVLDGGVVTELHYLGTDADVRRILGLPVQ